jgi:ankyrin repeat protein
MTDVVDKKKIFFAAAKQGSVANMQGVITEGFKETTSVDELGNTALHWSASADHLEAVQFEVEKLKININAQNKVGDTALHKAAWRGSLDCVKYLIDKDANLTILNKEGKKPVDLAHHLEVKSYLQSFEGDDVEDDEDADSDDE